MNYPGKLSIRSTVPIGSNKKGGRVDNSTTHNRLYGYRKRRELLLGVSTTSLFGWKEIQFIDHFRTHGFY